MPTTPTVETSQPRTQVVERVARILAVLARHGSDGCRLVDIAGETGIARPSAHRLLHELIAIGYVHQVENRRYSLGSALFSLGLSAPRPVRSIQSIRQAAQDLSNLCGDTVYVSIRHFDGVHYLVRTNGRFPIRVYAADVGDTLPFVNTYSGIVLLSSMGQATIARELSRWEHYANDDWGQVDPVRHQALITRAVQQAQTQGWVCGTDFYVPTIAGLAMAVPPKSGPQVLAVSISTVASRMPTERVPTLRAQLEATAQRIATFTE